LWFVVRLLGNERTKKKEKEAVRDAMAENLNGFFAQLTKRAAGGWRKHIR
jgi:hypothetical protein